MASYVDAQPKQFKPYTPTIDSQVYGQLLAKDDTDYQAGVQKVNSYLGTVAGLPVASEEERQYLQGLVNGVSSQVNHMVGASWSDQKVQGTVATMASNIYGDEKVQKAVANASTAKRLVSDIQEDEDRTKGQNTANKFVALTKLNSWRNGHTLGSTLDANYDNYLDASKLVSDYWTNKHPNQIVRVEPGMSLDKNGKPVLDIQKWDEVQHTWKGLRQDEVASELSEFIETNPNLANQLDINAKYSYRNYGPQQFFNEKFVTEKSNIKNNEQLIQQYMKDRVNAVPDSPDYQKITNKIDLLTKDTQNRQHYIDNGLYTDTYAFGTNPELRDTYLTNLFKQQFIHAQSRFYSYGEDDAKFIGNSPSQNFFEKQRILQADRTLVDKEKQDDFLDKLAKAKFDIYRDYTNARIKKLTGEVDGEMGLPNPDALVGDNMKDQTRVGPYAQTQQNLVSMDASLEDAKNKFMYSNYGKYGEDFFKFENGSPVPQNGKLDKINEDYKALQQRYKAGDPTLDQMSKDHFGQLEEQDVTRNLTVQKLSRNEKSWQDYVKNNPAITKIYEQVNDLNKNPQTIRNFNNVGNITVTGNTIMAYESIKEKVNDLYDKLNKFSGPGGGLRLASEKGNEEYNLLQQQKKDLFNSAGITQEVFNALASKGDYWTAMKGDVGHLVVGINKLPETKTNFLDERMRGSQIYTAQQTRGLLTEDRKYNEDIRNRALNIVNARGQQDILGGQDISKFNISGTQDPTSKKFFLVLQDRKGKKTPDMVELSDPEAASLGMKDIVSVDPVLTRLSLNDDRGLGANTGEPNGTMNYSNSFNTGVTQPDMDKNSPTFGHNINYRYGVTRKPVGNGSGWYVTVYPKDISTGKELDPIILPRQADWGTAKAKLNEKIGIHNSPTRRTYSYDAVIDNNTNSLLNDEEDNN